MVSIVKAIGDVYSKALTGLMENDFFTLRKMNRAANFVQIKCGRTVCFQSASPPPKEQIRGVMIQFFLLLIIQSERYPLGRSMLFYCIACRESSASLTILTMGDLR